MKGGTSGSGSNRYVDRQRKSDWIIKRAESDVLKMKNIMARQFLRSK
jgi:hypothetical protein